MDLSKAIASVRDAFTVRRALITGLVASGFASLGISISGVFSAGFGWDASTETASSIQVRSLPAGVGLQQAYESVHHVLELYGVLPQQLAEILRGLTTGNFEMMSPFSLSTFRYQEMVSVLAATWAAGLLGGAIAFVWRSLLGGAFAWALLMATPSYAGLAQVDNKDTLLMAGFTTLGVSAGLLSSPGASRWIRYAAVPLGIAGAAMALGTRPGSFAVILVLLAIPLAVQTIIAWHKRSAHYAIEATVWAASAVVGGVIFVWVTNPVARIDLVAWLRDSYTVVQQFPWVGDTFVAGHKLSLPADAMPWWYIPVWLVAQLPIATSILALSGLGLLVVTLTGKARIGLHRREVLAFSAIWAQGLLIPALIAYNGSFLYNGIRQVAFVLPPIIALATAPAVAVERRRINKCPKLNGRDWLPTGALLLAILPVAFSMAAQVRWYPYGYAHLNPLARVAGEDAISWDTDYWGITRREGINRLKAQGAKAVGMIPGGTPINGNTTLEAVKGARDGTFRVWGGVNVDELPIGGDPIGVYAHHVWAYETPKVPGRICRTAFDITRGSFLLGRGFLCGRN